MVTYDCSFVVCRLATGIGWFTLSIYLVLFSLIFASWDEGLCQSTRMEEREADT